MLLEYLIPLQNRFFTAKALRALRSHFSFGGERPPNEKPLVESEHALSAVPQP